MKALLIDGSAVTSYGLQHMMLNLTRGISLVEHLKNFQDASKVCRTREIDVVIFNTTSLDDQGIPFLRRLLKQWPRIRAYAMLPVIDRVSIEYLRRSNCVCGVFSVGTDLKDFHSLLKRPRRGRAVNFTPEIEESIYSPGLGHLIDDKLALLDRLSKREYDVLMLSMRGDRNKEIADKLHISSKTVCTHRCHIREKLAARTMQEVYRIVLEIRHNSTTTWNHLAMLVTDPKSNVFEIGAPETPAPSTF